MPIISFREGSHLLSECTFPSKSQPGALVFVYNCRKYQTMSGEKIKLMKICLLDTWWPSRDSPCLCFCKILEAIKGCLGKDPHYHINTNTIHACTNINIQKNGSDSVSCPIKCNKSAVGQSFFSTSFHHLALISVSVELALRNETRILTSFLYWIKYHSSWQL